MRFGLGWRPELAAGILGNLDRIDVIEILAEEHFEAGRDARRAVRFIRSQVPVVLHATSLGLASTERVDARRLDAVARVVEWLEPDFWSEHLAFVRAGSREVGHLAAPPRNDATLEGLMRNVELATRVVGSAPLLENVASLIDPPFSTYDEGSWLAAVPGRLLLDLHNLYANGENFGFDAREVVRAIPPERIGAVHLAGGRRIEGNRLLDDHLHAVPDPVYELLSEVHAEHATVILERDGRYPPIDELLHELDRAKWSAEAAPRRSNRARARAEARPPLSTPDVIPFLAELYSDPSARAAFLEAPRETALAAGFDRDAAATLGTIDPCDLAIAGRGFDAKRAQSSRVRPGKATQAVVGPA